MCTITETLPGAWYTVTRTGQVVDGTRIFRTMQHAKNLNIMFTCMLKFIHQNLFKNYANIHMQK